MTGPGRPDELWPYFERRTIAGELAKLATLVDVTTTPPKPSTPVGQHEIAELLDVAPATVRQWSWRGLLPEAEFLVGGRPAWRWSTIERWARETGRLP